MNPSCSLLTVGLVAVWGAATLACAADAPAPQGEHRLETSISMTVRLDYLLYLPPSYPTSTEDYPLILFLHGAGERGDELAKVKAHGPPKRVEAGDPFPFVIVSPQCPADGWWSSDLQVGALDALLTHVATQYRIDARRIYVTGLSMGGFGTWKLAATYPDRFAAIAPICGGGDPEDAEDIAHLPAWVFHGAKDSVVPLARSRDMVDALEQAEGDVTFTVYPEADHDSWTETYANPDLYEWFLAHALPDG